MKRFVLVLPLIGLAACDSGPDVDAKNAKPSEVADQMRDAVGQETFVRPGKWLSTVTIEEMTMPGMPPEFTARMKETMAKPRQVESCLTPAEAKRPKGDFFAADKSCTYDHFKLGDGKIDAAMRCDQGGVAQSLAMQGSYTPDSYQMAMSTRMEGKGPQAGTVMKMRVDAKRIGDCDGSEGAPAAN